MIWGSSSDDPFSDTARNSEDALDGPLSDGDVPAIKPNALAPNRRFPIDRH
jgi:hypothetical protein